MCVRLRVCASARLEWACLQGSADVCDSPRPSVPGLPHAVQSEERETDVRDGKLSLRARVSSQSVYAQRSGCAYTCVCVCVNKLHNAHTMPSVEVSRSLWLTVTYTSNRVGTVRTPLPLCWLVLVCLCVCVCVGARLRHWTHFCHFLELRKKQEEWRGQVVNRIKLSAQQPVCVVP